jgi:hypothetical protein
VCFDIAGQLLITYSAFVNYLNKKWKYNEEVHQLVVDFKNAYDSVRRVVLYNILIVLTLSISPCAWSSIYSILRYSRLAHNELMFLLHNFPYTICFGICLCHHQVYQHF